MKQIVMAVAVISAMALGVGCQSQPKPTPLPPPPSAAEISDLRERYARAFPDSRMGVITTILDSQPYLTVEEIDTKDLKPGDLFSIIDGQETVVAYGTVARVLSESRVALRFDEGIRRPMVGDVAVKF